MGNYYNLLSKKKVQISMTANLVHKTYAKFRFSFLSLTHFHLSLITNFITKSKIKVPKLGFQATLFTKYHNG